MYDQDGRRWDVLDLRTATGAPEVDLPLTLGVQQRVPARRRAGRVPAEGANGRRRRLRAEAKRRGKTPRARSLAWAAWTLVVTNTPTTLLSLLSLREARVLARARWQSALRFTWWKSHGHSDASRRGKPWRVRCAVYAKLRAMLVQHGLFLVSCWEYPARSLVKAARTLRQHALHLTSVLACPPSLCAAIAVIQRCLAAGCRSNRRKKKPHTYQLLLDLSPEGLG